MTWRARASDPNEQRRQAVVLLSDGDDNRSHVEFSDVLDDARRRTATIFTVFPGPFLDPDLLDPVRPKPNGLFEMRQLAEDTGGRAFTPATMAELGRIYQDIAGELSQQVPGWPTHLSPTRSPGSGASRCGRKPVPSCVPAREAGITVAAPAHRPP